MDIAEIRKRAKQLRVMEEPEEPEVKKEEDSLLEEPVFSALLPSGGGAIAAKPIEMDREIFITRPETPPPTDQPVKAVEEKIEPLVEQRPEITVDEYVEDLTAEAAKDMVEAITFTLDREEYAVDIRMVKEIIKPRELTDVPRAPKDIMGVISLRGSVIPIMNLRGRLGMPLKEEGERIIIVRDGTSLLGLIVDNVKQVVRVPKDNIEPPPSVNTIDGEFINGIGRYKGEMFILLELEKILESM